RAAFWLSVGKATRRARSACSRPSSNHAVAEAIAALRDALMKASQSSGGAGEGNRTLVVSLGSFCSTIELHPRCRNYNERAVGYIARAAEHPCRGHQSA